MWHSILFAPGIWLFGRNISTCTVRCMFKVSDFLADRVSIDAVVKQHCCDVVSEYRASSYVI